MSTATPPTESPSPMSDIAPLPRRVSVRAGAWALVVIGGALVVIAPFLPWFTAHSGGFPPGSFSIRLSGMDLDLFGQVRSLRFTWLVVLVLGILTLLLPFELALARLAGVSIPRTVHAIAILTGLVAVIFAVADISPIDHILNQARAGRPPSTAAIGYGFWLVIVGGVVTLIGGIWLVWQPAARDMRRQAR